MTLEYLITYSVDFGKPRIIQAIQMVAESRKLKFGQVAQTLRVALTGNATSPPINVVWDLIGEQRALLRMNRAVELKMEEY